MGDSTQLTVYSEKNVAEHRGPQGNLHISIIQRKQCDGSWCPNQGACPWPFV